MTSETSIELRGDREILMTRVFEAPRALVFQAHSEPEHVRQWWGPRGATVIHCELDFRVGGRWRFVLRNQHGAEEAFRGEFREIIVPERITWTFEYEGLPGHISVETMYFTEANGKTTLSAVSSFDSREERDGMVASGMEDGARQTWDRLAEHLERRQEPAR